MLQPKKVAMTVVEKYTYKPCCQEGVLWYLVLKAGVTVGEGLL